MNCLSILVMICYIAAFLDCAKAQSGDPFKNPALDPVGVAKHKLPTEAEKRTREILRTEELALITLQPGEQEKGFKILKDVLAKRGVTLRLKHSGKPKPECTAGGPLSLQNIPLDKFMQSFGEWASNWGWILYPDGSITYFDNVCACNSPKNGFYAHESQYEAGSPEIMEKEEKTALKNQE